jgi:hypothetical protein
MISALLAVVVSFSFVPPTEREDGTPLKIEEIKAYRVYVNGQRASTVRSDVTTFTLDLDTGTHQVHMTTVDKKERESQPSNTVTKIVGQLALPKAPVLNEN